MPTRIGIGSPVTSKLHVFAREQELGCATGFFAEHKGQLVLATNWHVVAGRNPENGEVLQRRGRRGGARNSYSTRALKI